MTLQEAIAKLLELPELEPFQKGESVDQRTLADPDYAWLMNVAIALDDGLPVSKQSLEQLVQRLAIRLTKENEDLTGMLRRIPEMAVLMGAVRGTGNVDRGDRLEADPDEDNLPDVEEEAEKRFAKRQAYGFAKRNLDEGLSRLLKHHRDEGEQPWDTQCRLQQDGNEELLKLLGGYDRLDRAFASEQA